MWMRSPGGERRGGSLARVGLAGLLILLAFGVTARAGRGQDRTATDAACVEESTLTLFSWNVFMNRRPAPVREALEQYVALYRPDVIFIQEAPVSAAFPFAEMAIFEGYHAFYAPAVTFSGREDGLESTGQLLLSRYPFDTTGVVVLPVLRSRVDEPHVRRNAGYARLRRCSGETLGLYNVHLENMALPAGRVRQVEHLLAFMAEQNDDVEIAGGDFNTFLTPLFEGALERMQAAGFTVVFRSYWSRWFPRMDHFMVRGAVPETGIDLEARGSDHDPIMVVVHLP